MPREDFLKTSLAQYYTDTLHQQTPTLGVPKLKDVTEKHEAGTSVRTCPDTPAYDLLRPSTCKSDDKISKRTGEAVGEIRMT